MLTVKAEIREDFSDLSRLFCKKFGCPRRVYYPACGNDATPALCFPQSEVILLDVNDWGDSIRGAVPNAVFVHSDASSYEPARGFDLVISIHSHAPFAAEVKDLKHGGYLIIANKMSDHAFDSKEFSLVGVVKEDSLITTDLVKFAEEGENDNPFANRRKIRADYYIFRKMN